MKIAENMSQLIGNTPLIKLNKVANDCKATVLGKLEFFNPCASVKDRIGVSMIEDAEKNNLIDEHTTLIEPTSGNTGIALAFVCAAKGFNLILTLPESMSFERRKLLTAFGAKIELTPAHLGMRGAIERAEELSKKIKKSFILHQFKNSANPEIHRKTTAEEIWQDTDGKIDIFVSGIGTGGTITGVSEVIKKRKPELISIGVEPTDSAILSGGVCGAHKIQGIGAGFVPEILNRDIIDEIIKVTNDEAYMMTKRLAKEEGIFCGVSSGAAVFAALRVAKRKEYKDKLIVTILPDTGERYLSTDIFE